MEECNLLQLEVGRLRRFQNKRTDFYFSSYFSYSIVMQRKRNVIYHSPASFGVGLQIDVALIGH